VRWYGGIAVRRSARRGYTRGARGEEGKSGRGRYPSFRGLPRGACGPRHLGLGPQCRDTRQGCDVAREFVPVHNCLG
jgi:hypothetical protein